MVTRSEKKGNPCQDSAPVTWQGLNTSEKETKAAQVLKFLALMLSLPVFVGLLMVDTVFGQDL